jgi:hypothetical protein
MAQLRKNYWKRCYKRKNDFKNEKKLIFCQSIRLPSHMLPSDIILSSGGRPHLPELVFFFKKIIITEMQKQMFGVDK